MSIYDDDYDENDAEFYDNNEEVMNTSLYGVNNNPGGSAFDNVFNNTNLKNGIIIAGYEIDDENNMNKKFPEYDVLVVEQSGTSTMEPVIYKNCITIDGFGGVADFLEFKLRPVENKEENSDAPLSTDFKKQFGSMVLILCLDGATDKGIIIKSIPHQGRKTNLTKDAGLHLQGEYNGLNWQIDKEGSLKITFKSKTDKEGTPQDETAGGTYVEIDKKGSVNLETGLKDKEETYIRMDKENKDVGLKAGQHIGLTAQQNIGLTADGKIAGKAKGSIEFAAEGTAKYTAKSTLDIEGKSKVGINSDRVMITGSNLVQIEGQKTMINSPKVFVGQGGTPAVIATTKFVGTGNHGAPVTCSAVGPFSAAVFIAS